MQPQITQVWADSAYRGQLVNWSGDFLDMTLETVSRPRGAKGFVALPRRWKVERTLGWIMKATTRRPRLRTPPTTLRSTPDLGTHRPRDPPPHPKGPTSAVVEESLISSSGTFEHDGYDLLFNVHGRQRLH
ncbi:hypothetical protein ACH4JZ_28570 [Streptomyces sp. NPDC017615]|uniref:hypothetical protein n=1 Tax=Streptomyces sp. NPDC017615 TaxID=3365003 RepID=UPI003788F294